MRVLAVVLLPRNVTVARSIDISAPAADIFPGVNSLKATLTWDLATDIGAGPVGRWLGLMLDS